MFNSFSDKSIVKITQKAILRVFALTGSWIHNNDSDMVRGGWATRCRWSHRGTARVAHINNNKYFTLCAELCVFSP